MTKQEKIKEAYGEYFEKLRNEIDNDGFVNTYNFTFSFNFEYEEKGFGVTHRIRPKSLAGIEHNNGWVKIESEDDLPKENCDVFIFANGRIDQRRFQVDISHLWINNVITHYQPIIKPKPPIF